MTVFVDSDGTLSAHLAGRLDIEDSRHEMTLF